MTQEEIEQYRETEKLLRAYQKVLRWNHKDGKPGRLRYLGSGLFALVDEDGIIVGFPSNEGKPIQ